ncbi:hypothetical protein ERJ70_05090 [Sediminibacillus dalangtanensis]|uniref:Uncharacterized protein n=1 Tax=Sediminibacillus dalangtanensis TaxID=2729421 RepID=A0ABX7VVT4_9BACI|nr:hypothetical protein [Sediminibacillus dalangtanensis]QTM98726.1 hypothetical protein ERJ70_05090 [Sediminibacillus dalangtanensis]
MRKRYTWRSFSSLIAAILLLAGMWLPFLNVVGFNLMMIGAVVNVVFTIYG